ncbi:hypothetical protein [Macrococcus equipercicus]|uniref:Uncharacterized protein n=1 Tax=Macrococcus equipercicus TaxID=69967 RepID=A0A9Q9F0P5_9STAP|nr:hypothetical protein [Macrococcus equipercicus]UTH13015.1 hypothetical protein KFV11_06955 [Macrococcus equipercicus]
MSDWVRTHDGRSLYRTAEGDLIDLTNAPPEYVADMVKARREERESKEQIAIQPIDKDSRKHNR